MINSDTIFALSSGSPPAGIAVVRISGPRARDTLISLTGKQAPEPRKASLARLTDPTAGTWLDQAVTIFFPGPRSATGEDVVELHLHGGRAVVAAVLETLVGQKGLRHAAPGEFTRRAFENERIDLAEAEGLADLLNAETEGQRRSAIAQLGGSLHRLTQNWVQQLLALSARIEAAIDFSDEDDVPDASVKGIRDDVSLILADIRQKLAAPPAERLHDGLRVAIIGPPNSGKSTLLNRLIGREAAIVSATPGTTRDVIEAHVRLNGLSLTFVDTAGIRFGSIDPIEKIGVERSVIETQSADMILALGDWQGTALNATVIRVAAKSDLQDHPAATGLSVSAKTGEGIGLLIDAITAAAELLLPAPDQISLALRHRTALKDAVHALAAIDLEENELLIAEHLRLARLAVGAVTGRGDTEEMLSVIFGQFCIGK